jgi:hypothetical protein
MPKRVVEQQGETPMRQRDTAPDSAERAEETLTVHLCRPYSRRATDGVFCPKKVLAKG